MTVYHIMGERDLVLTAELTATDLLWLLLGEVTHRQALAATQKTPKDITRKPEEKIAAAATRLTDAFCASAMSYNRLHSIEALYLW